MSIELGIDTFGDVTHDEAGQPLSHAQVIRNVVEQGILADQVGLDVIGIGEHHRDDFAISAPDMVLSAIASRTERLKLASAVTVLSSDDPVRVFQRFSTLNAISNGRAEVILGRGSFTESFPVFGYNLRDYDELFSEKLAMFAKLRDGGPITWQGKHTQNLDGITIYPPVEEGKLAAWIAVGGSPESVVRAANFALPLVLAIIGGPVERFVPYADLFRRALTELGHEQLPVGFHSFGHIAETDAQAAEELFEPYMAQVSRIGRERGWAPPSRAQYQAEITDGALMVGSPETVAKKIAAGLKSLGASRFTLKVSTATLSHEKISRSIELYGTKVAPLVRDLLA